MTTTLTEYSGSARMTGFLLRFKRWLVLSFVATIAATGMVFLAPASASAASESCWQWANSNAYKSIGLTLWKGNYTVQWCGSGGRVTKFWVFRCDVSDMNPAFGKDPGSDCRPRTGNGGTSLPIYGDMWVSSTVSYANKIGWNPGQLRMHYELTLFPDGRITGSVG